MTRTWNPIEPAETDTEAQAYVNGWYYCDEGNDIRGTVPYKNLHLKYAWLNGAHDCMESPDPDDHCPEPDAMGFPDTKPSQV